LDPNGTDSPKNFYDCAGVEGEDRDSEKVGMLENMIEKKVEEMVEKMVEKE
jgi:hypothetical protein